MSFKKKKVGRPRQRDKEIKINCSIRIHPSDKKKIKKKYLTIQAWIDDAVKKLL